MIIKDAEYHRIYRVWSGIKQRCYDKNDKSYGSYGGKGVTVAPEWMNFGNFYKWYIANKYECDDKLVMDKDILGGEIYSPETCLLIPEHINFSLPKKKRDTRHTTGVQRRGKMFEVKVRDNGVNTYIGTYKTLEAASSVYIKCKNELYQAMIDEYAGKMPDHTFKTLKAYSYE